MVTPPNFRVADVPHEASPSDPLRSDKVTPEIRSRFAVLCAAATSILEGACGWRLQELLESVHGASTEADAINYAETTDLNTE
jgi:hypothetical protein